MNLDEAREIVGRSKRITFFTGAGISAESGVPTFRAVNGLWETYDPDEFASIQGIARNTFFVFHIWVDLNDRAPDAHGNFHQRCCGTNP
jgi:NAD-dependent SIR2 family protein deacetylase